jgi:tetratricopeptide (TPR) repeat protein
LTIAHAAEQKARQEVQGQFALALDAVENSTKKAIDAALLEPALQTYHRKNLETALGFYKRLQASLENRTVDDSKSRANLATTYHRMATVSEQLGQLDEARAAYRKAIDLGESLVHDEPTVVPFRSGLAESYADFGDLLCGAGQRALGLEAFRRAIGLWEEIARSTQGVDAQAGLARTLASLGYRHLHANQIRQALEAFGRVYAIHEKLAHDHPDVPQHRADLAETLRIIGGCHAIASRPDAALEAFGEARGLLEPYLVANPDDLKGRSSLAIVLNNIGLLYEHRGRLDEALALFRRNLEFHQGLLKADPVSIRYRVMLAIAHGNVAETEYLAARHDKAIQSSREALALFKALDLAVPAAGYSGDVGRIHALLATIYVMAGRLAEAHSELAEAEGSLRRLPEPGNFALVRLAGAYAAISARAEKDERQEYSDRAMATLRRACAGGWHDLAELQSDPSFRPLRSRPDFEPLRMDVAFPAEPFAGPE